MGVAVAQPLSPELVLVCPELREHAVTLLPPLDPDELFAAAPPPAHRPAEPPRLVAVPPPRPAQRPSLPVAVAAYATEALVVGAIRGAALIAAIGAASYLLAR